MINNIIHDPSRNQNTTETEDYSPDKLESGNALPVAEDDSVAVPVGSTLTVNPLANDSDADGDTLTITQINGVDVLPGWQLWVNDVGLVALNDDYTFSITPFNDATSGSIPYTISDGNGGTSTANLNVEVTNTSPDANDDQVTGDAGSTLTLNPLANDTDADGHKIYIFQIDGQYVRYGSSVNIDGIGSATLNADNSVSIELEDGVTSGTFPYTVRDGYGGTSIANISFDMGAETPPQNNAPVAEDDSVAVPVGSTLTVNPLANDSDADGDTLTITQINGVDVLPGWQLWVNDVGLVALNDDYTFSITPFNDATAGSIPYTISDGNGGTSTANLNVEVTNTSPDANDDQATGDAGSTLTLNPLANDTDADGHKIYIFQIDGQYVRYGSSVNIDGIGSATLNADNSVSIELEDGVTSGTFPYTVRDGYGGTSIANISFDMGAETPPQNNAPVAEDDSVAVPVGSTLTVNPLANDSDADGDTLTITQINGVDVLPGWQLWVNDVGLVALNDDYTFSITPFNDATAGSIPYTISDGNGGTSTANLNVEVTNTSPDANDDQATGDAGSTLTLNPLANDTDADGHKIYIFQIDGQYVRYGSSVNIDGIGSATLNADNSVSIELEDGVTSGTFPYTVRDGYGGTSIANISFDMGAETPPQNNAPVAEDDSVAVPVGSTLTVNPLANDSDADGDTLTITQINGVDVLPGWQLWVNDVGLVALNDDYTFSITPFNDATSGSIPYTISDGNGGTSTANLNVEVTNTSPDANDDQVTGDAGSTLTLNPLANDTDADGHKIYIFQIDGQYVRYGSSVNIDGIGSATLNADNSVSIELEDGVTSGTFPYTVRDGYGGTSIANISFDMGAETPPQNNAPVAEDDSVTGETGEILELNPLANDSDADDETLTITQVNGQDVQSGDSITVDGTGVVTLNADGTVSIDPADGVTGGSIPYTISDGNGGTATANITFEVNAPIDPGTSSIGNRVWLDINGDGIQNQEHGAANVEVQLKDADGNVIATQMTNAQGQYLFENLKAGEYSVQVIAPEGYQFTKQGAGENNQDSDVNVNTGETDTITLGINQQINSVDAGLVDPATSSIGNQVWLDANGNYIQDEGEKGVANVEVRLKDAGGNVIATQKTDENGNYSFDGLEAGRYSIGIEELDGYELTKANRGNDDTLDSDLFPATNNSKFINLGVNEQNMTVDAGLVQNGIEADGRVWGDPHFRGADDELYEIKGMGKSFYNILSDSGIQVNARFREGTNGTTFLQNTGVVIDGNFIAFTAYGGLYINGEEMFGDGSFLGDTVTRDGDVVHITADDEYDLTLTRHDATDRWPNRMTIDIATDNAVADGVLPDGLWGVTVDGDGIARDGDRGRDAQGGGVIEDINGNITEKGDTTTVHTYEVNRIFDTNSEHHNKYHEEGVYISENTIASSNSAQTPNTIDAFVEELMA